MPRRRTTLAERIKYILEQEGWSQAELARALNIERSTVHEWIIGRSKSMQAETAFLAEERTGYAARWIVRGEGSPKVAIVNAAENGLLADIRKLPEDKRQAVRTFVDFQLTQ